MAYIRYNANPADKLVGDCVIRAISLLIDKEWDWVFSNLVAVAFEMKDMPSSNAVWSTFLSNLGYIREPMPNTCPVCYTVSDFCNDNIEGKYLLSTDGHVVTVINGHYYDTWDSGLEIPIYFWYKGE